MFASFQKHRFHFLLLALVLGCAFFVAPFWERATPAALASQPAAGTNQTVFLPLIQGAAINPVKPSARRVYAPYYDPTMWFGGAGIVWFGKITASENYADVRVGYNSTTLYVRLSVFDRRIFCNTNPQATDPTLWDGVVLNLKLNGNTGNAPDTNTYRLVAPFNGWVDCVAGKWTTTFRGNGSGWTAATVPFTIDNWYRGVGGVNQNADNSGWILTYQIPFTSFGLATPPAQGTTWGIGITLYDRDDAAGTPIPSHVWPENLAATQPSTYAQLVFGLPPSYAAPAATSRSSTTIVNGVNGISVPDAMVGGAMVCGSGLDIWTQWGEKNYAKQDQFNVQNQEDVADWPCFSKYYATFPLDSLPKGKVIISSTLTLYQFGNAGQGWTPPPFGSLIQISTINDDWNEATITWNNAPLAGELVSRASVDPLTVTPPWMGIPRTFDMSAAVANAYAAGIPLRLVIYDADNPMHSGKYFYASEASLESRPKLQIVWGDP